MPELKSRSFIEKFEFFESEFLERLGIGPGELWYVGRKVLDPHRRIIVEVSRPWVQAGTPPDV